MLRKQNPLYMQIAHSCLFMYVMNGGENNDGPKHCIYSIFFPHKIPGVVPQLRALTGHQSIIHQSVARGKHASYSAQSIAQMTP